MSEARTATIALSLANAVPMALVLERECAPGAPLGTRLAIAALGAGAALLIGALVESFPPRWNAAMASVLFALGLTLAFAEERAFAIFHEHLTAQLLSRASPLQLTREALVPPAQVAILFCAPFVLAAVELVAFVALKRIGQRRAWRLSPVALAAAGAVLVAPGFFLEARAPRPPPPAPPPVRPFWLTAFPPNPVPAVTPAQRPDIVWIVLDSWRADGLNAEDMPRTTAFAARGHRFLHAYAAGDETVLGMFSLLYSLSAPYLDGVQKNLLGAPLLNRLGEVGYDLRLRTSTPLELPPAAISMFTPPRFLAQRHPDAGAHGLARDDQRLVEDFAEDVARNDHSQPHFDLFFFTATHATYFYDAASRLHTPDEIPGGWGGFDPRVPASLTAVRNRYRNALAFSDRLIDGVLKVLAANGALDRTIVLLTADHGEGLDAATYGHAHSRATLEEIEIPLVLFLPGESPRT
ncbi:MAG TPA: sulfatase-like hydrolase/transferase, partial [bacterium]|nr:sulfatase-like hydrolase/transferase [bacterium]